MSRTVYKGAEVKAEAGVDVCLRCGVVMQQRLSVSYRPTQIALKDKWDGSGG